MNDDVRAEFRQQAGFDPLDLFEPNAQSAVDWRNFSISAPNWPAASRPNGSPRWKTSAKPNPQLDLTLTHVDDRFDTSMREKIGADASRRCPCSAQHDFTFLIEDPATIWNLGPQRYPQIAARYQAADAPHGQAGHRHQHRRALSGRLSHQAANRHGAVRAGAHRRGRLPARGPVL